MIVTVYIDESGTHDSGVTILGGWVGRLGQWATLDPKWKKLLKQSGLTYFHSKKMRHSKGEFKDWTISQKQTFMVAAAKIGLKHLEFGFTVSLRDDEYEQYYIAGHRPKEVPLDSRYGLCFRYCLGLVPHMAIDAFKGRALDIHFVLESGHPNYGDADRIFQRVKKSRVPHEQEIVGTLRTLTKADKIDFPGLQLADVSAYSMYQHLTRSPQKTIPLEPDFSIADAKRIQRVPVFHLRLGEAELKGFKKFIFDEIEEKKVRVPSSRNDDRAHKACRRAIVKPLTES